MNPKFSYLILYPMISILFLGMTSCSVKKHSNIDYGSHVGNVEDTPKLNVFTSTKASDELLPVLVFVYGGNWNSGRKGLYNYVGRNFAKHDMVTVLPDYTKSPIVDVETMTMQIATSIKWVLNNIEDYGGDPDRIYLTGHSAGAHLVALAAMNPDYGIQPDEVKGIILNDAAGLDMETYFKTNPPTSGQDYIATWTNNPEVWKSTSPINYIDSETPKIKI